MHKGSCHCGRIAFEVDGEPEGVVECNCSHCSRKGYLLWFVGRDQVRLSADCGGLSTYRFNRHVIEHHFCRYAAARRSDSAPTRPAARWRR